MEDRSEIGAEEGEETAEAEGGFDAVSEDEGPRDFGKRLSWVLPGGFGGYGGHGGRLGIEG